MINTQLDNGGKPLEENTGNELDAAGYQTAILPYSVGQWVYQANNHLNPTLDLRNGVSWRHHRGRQPRSTTCDGTSAACGSPTR